jgi:superfamily II DNA or RNA helicase
MKLRGWQNACIDLAYKKYVGGGKHFLTLATPGAGKTIKASALADRLLREGLIDLVFCFSPSSVVSKDFSEALQLIVNERFDGLLGSKGQSLTYQSMQYLDNEFWNLFKKYRVFVIFDEIHHCSGSNIENANGWGEQIILNIQDQAAYTVALTGTPWRSDTAPIVLSRYSNGSNKIECDYVYGLSEAISDDVCRIPQVVITDNDNISITEKNETRSFTCFKDLLSLSVFPYQEIIKDERVMIHLIELADQRLTSIRKVNPEAGGLVVASSVEHAHQIASIMYKKLREEALVVTYREDEPTQLIREFRNGNKKWVISVGMISEGTNIPRLQVCCHLTNIKTEMHYRQILGRILRMTDSDNQEAVLYMPAEPKLIEYAHRVAEDIPEEADVVKFEKMKTKFKANVQTEDETETTKRDSIERETNEEFDRHRLDLGAFKGNEQAEQALKDKLSENSFLSSSYEKMMDIYGRFQQETLELGLAPLK